MKPTSEAVTASSTKTWVFRGLCVLGSLLVLTLIDQGMRLVGMLPPEDPLVLHANKYIRGFTPFVDRGDGWLNIRPGWEKTDEVYRFTEGTRKGRVFLHPGFRPCEFKKKKPADSIRVVALGGSTTFGQWVGAEQSFPALIGQGLAARFPDHKIEMLNLGCPGLESQRVAILAESMLQYDPDLVVVYSGHNEMLMGETAAPPEQIAQSVRVRLLKRSAIVAWVNYWRFRNRHAAQIETLSEEAAALEMGQILSYNKRLPGLQQEPLSMDYRTRVLEAYGENMTRLSASARQAGVPVLFILPASNLLHPPGASAHSPSSKALDDFDALLTAAESAVQAATPQRALELAEQAVELSPEFAMARYLRGAAMGNMARKEEALSDLQVALDLSVDANRMTSPLQARLVQVTRQSGDPLVDLRPLFQTHVSTTRARELFVDHCHPTVEGHRMIAEQAMPAVLNRLADRLGQIAPE